MAYVCYAKWRHYPQRFYDLLPGEVMHHWRKGNCERIIKERDKHRQQQGGKGFLPLPVGIMLPNLCTSFSTRKGIGIHKDFCRQPQIAAGRHILPSVSYHCSPVQCNICNCLFLLLNSLRLCSNYITKNNISTISGKVMSFSLPFSFTVQEITVFLLEIWKICI